MRWCGGWLAKPFFSVIFTSASDSLSISQPLAAVLVAGCLDLSLPVDFRKGSLLHSGLLRRVHDIRRVYPCADISAALSLLLPLRLCHCLLP